MQLPPNELNEKAFTEKVKANTAPITIDLLSFTETNLIFRYL